MTRSARAAGTAALVLVAIVLTGCVGYNVVKGGEKVSVGSGLTVTPAKDWNQFTSPTVEYWTLDGPSLQHVLFVKGVEDGQTIYYLPGSNSAESEKKGLPIYRKGMNEIEISELVQATMAREEMQQLKLRALTSETFAGQPGFSFRFECVTKQGLEIEGLAAGAVINDRLYMAIYRGAKLYYFDRGLPDFRRMLESVRIEKTS